MNAGETHPSDHRVSESMTAGEYGDQLPSTSVAEDSWNTGKRRQFDSDLGNHGVHGITHRKVKWLHKARE